METRILLFVVVLGNLTCAAVSSSSSSKRVSSCPLGSSKDHILGFRDRYCPVSWPGGEESDAHPSFGSVTRGNERCLQIMLDMIHKRECKYVAVLFFASWCPFSRSFRPTFSIISSLYSSIPHFAIEESSVGSSVLSKYGVHGFPTLFIMNSTMRVRYQGPSRSLSSLVAFYRDVTGEGFKFKPMELSSIEKLDEASVEENRLVNLLRQETCLALATVFVLLRLLHSVFPTLVMFVKFTSRLFAQNMSLDSLLEHTVVYLSRVVQLCIRLKEPRKRRNLQEGAMNAGAWASKSLATVSIGDSSSSSR